MTRVFLRTKRGWIDVTRCDRATGSGGVCARKTPLLSPGNFVAYDGRRKRSAEQHKPGGLAICAQKVRMVKPEFVTEASTGAVG